MEKRKKLEMMNKDFYNRMVNSTKKLFEAEPKKEALKADSSLETQTPSSRKKRARVKKRNDPITKHVRRRATN